VCGGSSGAQRPRSGEARSGCSVASGADADLRAGLMKRAAAGLCYWAAAASGPVRGLPHSRWILTAQHAHQKMIKQRCCSFEVFASRQAECRQPRVSSGLAAHTNMLLSGATVSKTVCFNLWVGNTAVLDDLYRVRGVTSEKRLTPCLLCHPTCTYPQHDHCIAHIALKTDKAFILMTTTLRHSANNKLRGQHPTNRLLHASQTASATPEPKAQ
jgi:hypothetical protein